MNLSIQILIALVLSVAVGLGVGPEGLPFINKWIAPIGTIFINFIKMMIVPVVFCSLIVGVTSLGGDSKKLGRISAKTIGLYLCTTAVAIVLGFVVAGIIHPGEGLDIAGKVAPKVKEAPTFMQVLVNMVPTNPVDSMAKAQILPIIVFALFVGVGILSMSFLMILSDNRSLAITLETDSMCYVTVLRKIATATTSATWNEIVYKSLFLVI